MDNDGLTAQNLLIDDIKHNKERWKKYKAMAEMYRALYRDGEKAKFHRDTP